MANCTAMRTALSIDLMDKSVFIFSSIATCFFSICGLVEVLRENRVQPGGAIVSPSSYSRH